MEPELTVAASSAPSALLAIALQARGDALGAGGNVETPHGYLTLVVAEREGVVRGGDGEPDPP